MINNWLALLLLTFPLVQSSSVASSSRSQGAIVEVVLSTDCGVEVDDQWALVHLALCSNIDLKGVISSHAPGLPKPEAEFTAKAARDILAKLPAERRRKVIAGSSDPLASTEKPARGVGVDFLLEESQGHSPKDRLVVVMIGPATDVASALLIEPSFADRARVVAMAFGSWPNGTDSWNVKNDVKAWQVVLASRIPLVVGDASVCKKHLLMTPKNARMFLPAHNGVADALIGFLDRWLEQHSELAERITIRKNAWPIWDEVATAYLLGLATTKTVPRPTLRDDMTLDHRPTELTIEWIVAVDDAKLWSDLASRLEASGGK